MKKQLIIVLGCIFAMMFTACSKKAEQSKAEQASASTSTVTDNKFTTPEQQAQIDALDKPVLDEKNTDVQNPDATASEVKVQ